MASIHPRSHCPGQNQRDASSRTPGTSHRTPLSVKNVQPKAQEEDGVLEDFQQSGKVGRSGGPLYKEAADNRTLMMQKGVRQGEVTRAPQRVSSKFPTACFNTPSRKRSVPREEVHARNVVLDTDDGSPPHKKSRSSKDDGQSSGTAVGAEATGSTASAIAGDLRKMAVGPDKTSMSEAQGHQPSAKPVPSDSHTRKEESRLHVKGGGGASAHPTTTRIDKHPRLSAAERSAREEIQKQQMVAWRRKYAYAFASFAFYLDGFDEKQKNQMTRAIQHCGGRTEPFFDRSCSHIVCAQRQPVSTAATPSPVNSGPSRLPVAAVRKTETKRFSPSKKGIGRQNREVPLHSDRNPFEDGTGPLPTSNASDLVRKATKWGIRVWSLEKFWSTINMLAGTTVGGTASAAGKQDLAKMLEYEKVQGTLERDMNAPQNGWRYLDKRNIFILVGDATEEHRAVMFHEFARTEKSDSETFNESVPWPRLYGEHEGRCPFTKYAPRKKRDNVARGDEDGRRVAGEREIASQQLKHAQPLAQQHLDSGLSAGATPPIPSRRLQAVEQMRASASPAPDLFHPHDEAASPYQLASGNSVSVASNMTSAIGHFGSTASLAGSLQGMGGHGTPNFALQNKRVAELGRRMVPSAASPAVTAMGHHSPDDSRSNMSRSVSMPKPTDPAAHGALVRQMLGMTNDATDLRGRADPSLKGTALRRSASMQNFGQTDAKNRKAEAKTARVEAAAAGVVAPDKDKDKKELFCENCRKKFHDFDQHINSDEHRKFALNPANFAHVDDLIHRLVRPHAPWINQPQGQRILRIAHGDSHLDEHFLETDAEDAEESGGAIADEGHEADFFDDYINDSGDEQEENLSEEPADQCDQLAPEISTLGESFYPEDEAVDPSVGGHDGTISPGDQSAGKQSIEWNTSYEGDYEGDLTPRTSSEAHEPEVDATAIVKTVP